MPTLRSLTVSEGVSLDLATRQLSIFNIFENIGAPRFPIFIQNLCVVGLFEKNDDDRSEYSGTCNITNNAIEIAKTPIKILFKTGKRHRVIAKFQGIPVKDPGYLEIALEVDGNIVGATKIEISLVPQSSIINSNFEV